MNHYASYPPNRRLSTRAVPQSEALALLSAYLEAAATDPSLHPGALLTAHGPTSATHGTARGLVLHNLKRVEAGLRGERLGVDELAEERDGLGTALSVLDDGDAALEVAESQVDEGNAGWQDKAEFERQQEVEEGEVADRQMAGLAHSEGGPTPEVKTSRVEDQSEGPKKKRRKEKHGMSEEAENEKSKEKSREKSGEWSREKSSEKSREKSRENKQNEQSREKQKEKSRELKQKNGTDGNREANEKSREREEIHGQSGDREETETSREEKRNEKSREEKRNEKSKEKKPSEKSKRRKENEKSKERKQEDGQGKERKKDRKSRERAEIVTKDQPPEIDEPTHTATGEERDARRSKKKRKIESAK